MVIVETTIWLTPDEFRKALSEELQELFDNLVSSLAEGSALSEEEAKGLVARMMLDALKQKEASEK